MEAQIVFDHHLRRLVNQRDNAREDLDCARQDLRYEKDRADENAAGAETAEEAEEEAARERRARKLLLLWLSDNLVDRLAHAGVGRGYPPGLWDVERDLPAAIDELLAERAGRDHG